MRLLLDTHVFVWLQIAPERLGRHQTLVEDEGNQLLVSAATSWEIAIKYQIGKLPLPDPPDRWVPESIRAIGARPIAVEHEHALAVAGLPTLHGDPFDRLLVAQAKLLELTLLTADARLADYPVTTILVA